MWFILIGAIMNFAAIILNQGSMPIDMNALEQLGFKNMLNSINMGALPQYIPLEKAAIYTAYLGKRISLPKFYPFKQIFSIGDALVALGIFFLLQNMLLPSLYRRTSRTIQFDHKKRTFR